MLTYCNKEVLPLPFAQGRTDGIGMWAYKAPDEPAYGYFNRGVVRWLDGDACGVCGYLPEWTNAGFTNPMYDDYTVEVYEDGKLKFTEPHWKHMSNFADNTTTLPKPSGDFHYYFPVTDGHNYSVRVGKNGKDGTVVWSGVLSFSTVIAPPVVPTTVQTTAGQKTKKK